MAYYNQGVFQPKNPKKYLGSTPPTFRSAWELTMMRTFDDHPSVIQWASESIKIPYQDPLTGKWRQYIPDFLVLYMDRNGRKHGEIIEVKPMSQTLAEKAKSRRDREAVILNHAKWTAAQAFCQRQGLSFRVMNENHIYQQKGRK